MDKKTARRASRALAVETFFAYLARDQKVELEETFVYIAKEIELKKGFDKFAFEIISKAGEHFKVLKVIIRSLAPEFAFEKIALINRVILILGLAEMKFIETPPIVVINEYIELAKDFGEDKSAGFINGVLDAYRKNLEAVKKTKE
jgi:N utilization substance protein B